MNVKAFFVDALQSALDLGIATPDDVVRHVTPDVLAAHLPRPLWARLLTACIGAPKVDATLVVETLGVPNLCEHVPSAIIWALIADVGGRSLGAGIPAPPPPKVAEKSDKPDKPDKPVSKPADKSPRVEREKTATEVNPVVEPPPPRVAQKTPVKPLSISSPPPPDVKPTPPPPPAVVGPSIPTPNSSPAISVDLDDVVAELDAETQPPQRARTPTGQRFRQTNTNIGRLANTAGQRRPQAQANAPEPATPARAPTAPPDRPARRGETEIEVETDVGDWRTALAVEDEQLVDWSSSEETMTSTSGSSSDADHRKR